MSEKKAPKTIPCGCGCQSSPKKDGEAAAKKEKKSKK